MIIDHIGLAVSDYEKSKEFFCKALSPLGIVLVTEKHGWAGLGKNGKPEFWFGIHSAAQLPLHIAFLADSPRQVDAFYEAALAAGGTDNGPPGIREFYHPNYYGAFVLGPDGHNVEAVCHEPEPHEVAATICWLASEDCSFATGAVFDISGGRATY